MFLSNHKPNKLLLSAVLATAFVVSILLYAGCGNDDSDNNGNNLPTGNWVADGIISSGEYADSRAFGNNYEIHWRSDAQFAYFAVKAFTDGWVAVSFQPDPSLKKLGADMVLGYVENGQTIIYDLHATGAYGPHPLDTDLGGTYDILEFAGNETGGYTTIEFKRALSTQDQYDQDITSGNNNILWAYGTEDSLFTGHRAEEAGQPEGESGYGKITV